MRGFMLYILSTKFQSYPEKETKEIKLELAKTLRLIVESRVCFTKQFHPTKCFSFNQMFASNHAYFSELADLHLGKGNA